MGNLKKSRQKMQFYQPIELYQPFERYQRIEPRPRARYSHNNYCNNLERYQITESRPSSRYSHNNYCNNLERKMRMNRRFDEFSDDFFTRDYRMPVERQRTTNDLFLNDFDHGLQISLNGFDNAEIQFNGIKQLPEGVQAKSISKSTVIENGNKKTVTEKSIKKPDGTIQTKIKEESEDAEGNKTIKKGEKTFDQKRPIISSIQEFKNETPKALKSKETEIYCSSLQDLDEERSAEELRHSKVPSDQKIKLLCDDE